MAYNSKNIFKSKEFWIGFLVAVIVFVGLGELQRSNNRAAALSDLNTKFSKITNQAAKAALVIRDEAVVKSNKSWFSFFNSNAMEADPNDPSTQNQCSGNALDWTCNLRNDRDLIGEVTTSTVIPGVSDSSVWMNPETGQWSDNGVNKQPCGPDGC